MSFKTMLSQKTAQAKKGIQKATDTVKLYSEKSRINAELSELFDALGRVRYAELSLGTENPDESATLVNEITEANAELDKIEAELAKLNNKKRCEQCNREIDKKAMFCPYCGAKIEEEVATEEVSEQSGSEDNTEAEG